jgi:hypothetical protein
MIYLSISLDNEQWDGFLLYELFTLAFSRPYVGVGPKDDYPYRNGPLRSSPPALADIPSSGVGGPRPMQQGAVMMVYGLCKDRVNAERLFNIFCLYGNVVRVCCLLYNSIL